jgi:hypothetical protein
MVGNQDQETTMTFATVTRVSLAGTVLALLTIGGASAGEFRVSGDKAVKAKDSSVSDYHKEKQKGLIKWRKWLEQKNPDLFRLDGQLVARLKLDEGKLEEAKSRGNIYQDSTRSYFGEVVRINQGNPGSSSGNRPPPQPGNAGELPPRSPSPEAKLDPGSGDSQPASPKSGTTHALGGLSRRGAR